MSRRNPRARRPRHGPDARPGASTAVATAPATAPAGTGDDPDVEFALWLGERLRRLALGATAALVVARAYWPSEPDFREDAGGGLVWVLAVLAVLGVAVASALVSGSLRFRWSRTDAAVIALMFLVASSARYAIDVRPAVNLACEWGALGVVYLLARNLPRTRAESAAMAGALAATAVAVAVYALYQVGVELPEVQRKFEANPAEALRIVGIEPGTPQADLFRDRLVGSTEPYSTFALANSLAGFLVGPLVVMLAIAWDNLTRREGWGSRFGALLLAAVPISAVVVCLTLTKSRSAWLGLLAGLVVLAWRESRRVSRRTLLLGVIAVTAVVAGLVIAGAVTRRLDVQVLTQSGKSLRYRWEYWVGAWRAITASPAAFWRGQGPGNFSAPYVLHKLPQASEDIHDPHNFVLEVWAAAGFWAVLALAAAVMLALWNLLGPSRAVAVSSDLSDSDDALTTTRPKAKRHDPDAPPAGVGWLVGAGALGWLVAMPPIGGLNPFADDLVVRWLILGGAWVLAVLAGQWLWRRRPVEAAAVGLGVLAVFVNLIAAGGIGVPAVAVGLWVAVAVGLNLRDDRPCSRLRVSNGRLAAIGLAVVWAALVGTFVGWARPHWKIEAALAEAHQLASARPPDYDRAEIVLEHAATLDKFSARPWLAMARLHYQQWMARGGKHDDLRWRKIPIDMKLAVTPPRAPNSWTRHRDRAWWTTLLLAQLGDKVSPMEQTRYRGNVVEACRTAALLYPTNARLRARLAEASAEIGYIPDAVKEGREALRLDALTPHADKKLDQEVRVWLESRLPVWEKSAAEVGSAVDGRAKAKAKAEAADKGPTGTPPSQK
jgi:O-antigen ligase